MVYMWHLAVVVLVDAHAWPAKYQGVRKKGPITGDGGGVGHGGRGGGGGGGRGAIDTLLSV